MANIKGFSFFASYYDVMKILDDEESGQLIKAMSGYMFEGLEPSFESKDLKITWAMIKPHLDVSLKRSASGKKGKLKFYEDQDEYLD